MSEYRCNFPCDGDCDADCHQAHLPQHKRLADMCGCAERSTLRQRVTEALASTNTLDEIDLDHTLGLVLAVCDEELERVRAERDQAIAHDRQPYPTQWAYDQACAALETHRARADRAEQEVARLQGIIDRHDHGIMPVCEGYMAAKAQRADEMIARIRADCEEQASKPPTDDLTRGIWAQARRTLNTLDAIPKEQA